MRRGITQAVRFTDNDASKHGKKLAGCIIIPPHNLDPGTDVVLITSISAGDRISVQLEKMGFSRGRNFFEIMHQLSTGLAFNEIAFYRRYVDSFNGKHILHVGPGGHLGTEFLLHGLGAHSVISLEYHSFHLQYPEITGVLWFYEKLEQQARQILDVELAELRLYSSKNGNWYINTRKLPLFHPCSITALPFKSDSFDLVFHHTVFEHVQTPETGYREIFRVLKPGGKTVGLVDPQDHRTFSSMGAYHPLKFLEYERTGWLKIAEKINFHNQVTTPEHQRMILDCGFVIEAWNPLMEMPIPPEMHRGFHPYFHRFNPSELGVLRFGFSASKP